MNLLFDVSIISSFNCVPVFILMSCTMQTVSFSALIERVEEYRENGSGIMNEKWWNTAKIRVYYSKQQRVQGHNSKICRSCAIKISHRIRLFTFLLSPKCSISIGCACFFFKHSSTIFHLERHFATYNHFVVFSRVNVWLLVSSFLLLLWPLFVATSTESWEHNLLIFSILSNTAFGDHTDTFISPTAGRL